MRTISFNISLDADTAIKIANALKIQEPKIWKELSNELKGLIEEKYPELMEVKE